MLIPNWLKSLRVRPHRFQRSIRRSKAQERPAANTAEYLEDRTLLTSLNSVIDAVLDANDGADGFFDPEKGPTTQAHTFTTSDVNVPASVDIGVDGTGLADLRLNNVTLTFQPGIHFSGGSWSGDVAVTAPTGVMYPGTLGINISDDGNDTDNGDDADSNAVVGVIDLETGTSANLALDSLEADDIGLPAFLDIAITDVDLKFDDFRGAETDNTLELDAAFNGIDTGSDTLNLLLETDVTVTGSVTGLELDMDVIKTGIRDISSGKVTFPNSPIKSLSGMNGSISGTLFAADVTGGFIVNTVTVDPDGDGPKPEQSVLYAALQGSIAIEDQLGFGLAFAFSELGPLQVYGHSDVDIPIGKTSFVIGELRAGARFSTTIEDLQTETDFSATAGIYDSEESTVTLTIPDHDLVVGNELRVRNADVEGYEGEFVVTAVDGNDVTYATNSDPGTWVGDAEIVRVTITDPLDLRDSGLSSGIAPPEDVSEWQTQLDTAVSNQIKVGNDVWGRLFSEIVFGGGGTINHSKIPPEVMSLNADFMLGTSIADDAVSVSMWVNGTMSLYEDTLTLPTTMYANLGAKANDFSGKFLYLSDVSPNIPDFETEPLYTNRGSVSFETIADANDKIVGFKIDLTGGVDVHVPLITTVTLEGKTTFAFTKDAAVLKLDLNFDATLSEETIGDIATAEGQFHTTIDTANNEVELWGAALLGTDFSFLEQFGLFANTNGLLRLNTSDEAKPDEVLEDTSGEDVEIALPPESFALRLDGSVDFRIDHNLDGSFTTSERVFQIAGVFVMEFSPAGFNVAMFKEGPDNTVVPAKLRLGLANQTLVEFGVLGFLAIREDGFAADLVLSVDAALPGGLASIAGAAVLVVNTTQKDVVFNIPGGALDPNRPTGLTVTIPKAAPADPASVLKKPDKNGTASGLDALKTGSPDWEEAAAGPYGVLFADAEMDLLQVLEFDFTGYVLLSDAGLNLQANFYAGGSFLGLASGSVGGSLFYSPEGEFELDLDAEARLGPSWINIDGEAGLKISYLDENGKTSGGSGNKELNITGDLDVALNVNVSPFPSVSLTLADLSVAYNSTSGNITVGVTYPEPFWDEHCVDLGWFGSACFPYPNVRNAPFSFTVGNLQLTDPPPPPVLGQVDSNGVLTVNAGSLANRTARKLRTDETNESVIIEAIGPLSGGSQTISLRMFDVTQEFENVTSINIIDMGDGKDVVEVWSGVKVPGTVTLGAGDDRFINRSSGSAWTVYGGDGADRLRGSSASETFRGGNDNDVIEGGGGIDTIFGEAGRDTLLVAIRGSEAKSVNANLSNAGFTATIGDEALPAITDIEVLSIENEAGREKADTVTINIQDDTSSLALDAVNVALGADELADTVIINGSASGDTIDVSTNVVELIETVATSSGGTETTKTPVDVIRVARGGIDIDFYDVGSTFGADTVTVNTLGGNDTININTTLPGTTITANGGAGVDTINIGGRETQDPNITLETIRGPVVVNGNGGSDILNLIDSGDVAGDTDGRLTGTTVSGAGIGVGVTYGTIGTININLGSATDAFEIASTHSGNTNVHAGAGNDTVDLVTTGGATTVSGGAGDDTLRVNSASSTTNALSGAVVLNGQGGSDTHDVNISGAGTSTVSVFDSGTTGSDSLTIDGTSNNDDFVLRAANTSGVAFVAAVHASQAERVNYNTSVEQLTVNTAGGSDNVVLGRGETGFAIGSETNRNMSVLSELDINLGSGLAADHVTLNGSATSDIFDISTNGATYRVGHRGDATINIHEAGSGSDTVTVSAHGSADTINIDETKAGVITTVNGGADADTINVGDASIAGGSGQLEGIVGSLTINGNDGADVLNIDDTADTTGETDGVLTATTIDGAGIGPAVTYGSVGTVNVQLGSGNDQFNVSSTHTGSTNIFGGGGNDTIDVESTGGATTVLGEAGNDNLRINNVVGTESNGLNGAVTLDGQTGADTYGINIFGDGNSDVSVLDTGSSNSEVDALTVNGTPGADEFVLRASITAGKAFVAAVHGTDAERVNYDAQLEELTVDTATGTDNVQVGRGESGFALSSETNTNMSVIPEVNVRLGEDTAQDSVFVHGSSAAETFDLTTNVDVARVSRRTGTAIDIHEATGNVDAITVSAHGAADTINVDSTLTATATTVNGGDAVDTINVGSNASTGGSGDLEGIVGALVVNGNDGDDVLNLDDTGDTDGDTDGELTGTTIDGHGIGAGIAYGSINQLNINLGNGIDEFNVASTHAANTTIRGGGNRDTIDVESAVGSTTVLGEGGFDTLRVNSITDSEANGLSATVALDGEGGSDTYDINIFGNGNSLVTVFDSGASGTDSLTIDGTADADDFVLRASNTADQAFVAAVHGADSERVNYDTQLEELTLDTAGGIDNVELGRGESGIALSSETNTDMSVIPEVKVRLGEDTVQDNVIVHGSSAAETFDLTTDGNVARVARRAGTTVDIHEAGGNADTVTVNAHGATDTINVDSTLTATTTTVNGGDAVDTINVGSKATTSGSGDLEGIGGSLVVNGNDGDDILNVDDTGDALGDTDGELTGTTINGAGIGAGVTYDSIDTLNISLGDAADEFQIASTHAGDTILKGGDGNDVVNVETIAGGTTLLGEAGDDNLRVNDAVAAESNGLATTLVLDGQAGSDNYEINIYGNGGSLITAFDSGTGENDTLTINGRDTADEFVLRSSTVADIGFVAALHGNDVERVNYDVQLENLIVDTADGSDNITLGRAETGFAIPSETNTDASVLNQVRLNLGDDTVRDNIVFNGTSGSDTIDLSTSKDGGADVYSVARRGDMEVNIYEAGADTVTVNAQSSADTINVNGTEAGTFTTINGDSEVDTINIGSEASTGGNGHLEDIAGSLVINGNDGADVLNVDDTGDALGDTDGELTATTINGAGIGAGVTYDSIDTLNISLGDAADEFQIASTHTGDTILKSGGGNDVVNVETIAGGTTLLGEAGDDNLRVNDAVAAESNGLATTLVLDGQAGSDNYDINIYGNGGSLITAFDSGTGENDTLTINGRDTADDFVLRSSTVADIGFVAALHGNDVERVNYDVQLENLIVDTADGSDNITLGRAETGFALPSETNTDASVLNQVRLNLGDDTVRDNIVFNGTSGSDTIDLSTSKDGGADVYSVARRGDMQLDIYEAGTGFGTDTVTVEAQDSADTINVNGTRGGTITTLNAGMEIDTINVGSESSTGGNGRLEDIAGTLIINGQGGADVLNIDDTGDAVGDSDGELTATTIDGAGIDEGITYDSIDTLNIALGSGPDAFNILTTHAGDTVLRGGGDNDTLDVETIAGGVTVLGEAGDDNIRVNPVIAAGPNGLATTLVLDGQAGNDDYDVNIYGNGDSLITVFDTGSSANEDDTLSVYGTAGSDDFLLRASNKSSADGGVAFVAALHGEDVERLNYDERLENLLVDTRASDDHVTLDDNWAETTVRGGAGEDEFQVGQIFQSDRDAAAANIANEDHFATVETTRGFLSNGVSSTTTIQGGNDADVFVVFRNTAELNLDGQGGDDLFTVRAFAEEGSWESSIELGQGGDTVEYIGNADLNVNGGTGNDTLRVIGTEFSDNYLVTSTSIRGTGRTITYDTIEFLEIDGAEGDDEFFVFSTPSTLTARLFGGLGNDQFHLGGDSKRVTAENNTVIDPLQGPHDLSGIQGPLVIDGFSGAGTSGGLTSPVMLPGEKNLAESHGSVIAHSGTGEAGTDDVLTTMTADLQAVVDADSTLEAIADLIGRTLTITDGPGLYRFWQIAAIADASENQSELTLKNLSLGTSDWASPDETSSWAISNLSGNFFVDESLTMDVLTVFDDGSTANKVGAVTASTITGLGATGGVTYANMEIMQVLLGVGNDTLNVSAIADGTVAAIHGGGGHDNITVNGRGDLPLVVYGDTSEDGTLYSSNSGTVQPGFANSFANNGDDTIDASSSSQHMLIYGGPGNDTLTGSQAGDHLAGGAGHDHINGEFGDDHIYGDSSFKVNSQLLAQDQITPYDPNAAEGLANINATFEIVTTAVPGNDTIDGGEDDDKIFGDYGVITLVEGTRNIWTTDASFNLKLETTKVSEGGNDLIYGSGGRDFLFGGMANDTMHGGGGRDTLLGDHGIIDLIVNDNDNTTVDLIESNNPTVGGDDVLTGGTAKDILFGGTANDSISAGSGNDVALGDHGLFDYSADPNQNFTSIFIADNTGAGNDTIHGDEGHDFILGQQGDDSIDGGDGEDDLTGGHNVLHGADGHDFINGGADADVILGDNGVITRTLLNGEEAEWHRHPAPFTDVIRDIQRFDNVDLIEGDDTIHGGSGSDILRPQRGHDNVDGGADDDEIIGSEGNDTLAGGSGADYILGDNGQILRAYNSDGSPQINDHGIWHRDIVLEEYASLTGTFDIDRTPEGGNTPIATQLMHSDLLIVAGAFDNDENRLRNLDNNAWDTDILLVDLVPAGHDVIDGGEDADVILGQRGNDDISGGGGSDLIVGDNATSLIQFEATMPQIIHGLRFLEATNVPVELEFGGTVIVPEIEMLPSDLSLTLPMSDQVTNVSPELRAIALDDALPTTDGRSLVPYVSMVPQIGGHADVLAGNDTIDGGGGNDSIYGDNLRAFAQWHKIQPQLNVAETNVRKRLSDVDDAIRTLTQTMNLAEPGLFGATRENQVSVGNDNIRGGNGNDTIVGDDGTIITPASARSALDPENYQAEAVAELQHLLNLKQLLIDFKLTLKEADTELLTMMVDDALANNPSRTKIGLDDVIQLHHHDYVMQNDIVHGDAGNDTIIGDHSLKLLPLASSLKTRTEHPDPQEVPLQVQNATSKALGDIVSARGTEMRDHLKLDHIKSEIPKRRDQKLIPFKFEYTVSMSNDELNGDDGVDVIIGDRAETVMPILLEGPDRNTDANELVGSLNATTNRGRLRSQIEIREPVSHVEHRYFTGRIHKSTTEPAESVRQDTIDGGANSDTLIGDNAEIKPIFVRDVTLDNVTYAVTPIELRKGGDDVISGGLGSDVVFGQMGNDLIRGNEGKDTLWGGRGEDIIHGDEGSDEIRGGGNRDAIHGEGQDSKVLAGGGNGINDVDVEVHNPWGQLVDNIFSDANNTDPNTNLWETFIRGDEEGGE